MGQILGGIVSRLDHHGPHGVLGRFGHAMAEENVTIVWRMEPDRQQQSSPC